VSKQKVSITNDVAVVPWSFHMFIPLPPGAVPPVIASHLELPSTIHWPPGHGLGQNKLTATVFHRGKTIAKSGHDCGALIPHVSVPPAPVNLLLLTILPFSSRKMVFDASTVKMDGDPVGTSDLLAIPTPMVFCAAPVGIPGSFPVTNMTNTVNVGMTVGDFVAGAANIGFSMAADIITGGLPPGISDLVGVGIKSLASVATGVTKIVATGEGKVEFGLGTPWFGGKLEVGVDKKGTWSLTVEGRVGNKSQANKYDTKDTKEVTTTNDRPFGNEVTKEVTNEKGEKTVTVTTTDYDTKGNATVTKGEYKYDANGNLVEVNGKPPDHVGSKQPHYAKDAAMGDEDEPL